MESADIQRQASPSVILQSDLKEYFYDHAPTVPQVCHPLAAAAVLALNGVAYAGTGTSPEQTPEKPVDCKKTPNDPKCINK